MPLSIELAIKISELPFIQEVNLLKQEVDTFRPLDNETEQKIIQKFRLLWNYHSNAIEGNQLTYGETYAFLMEGVTAKGKTLKDHLDIKGHDETVKYLFDLIKSRDYEITESEIRNLHKMLLKEPYEVDAITADGKPTKRKIQIGEYKSFPNHVQTATGEIHYYATPQETPIRMGELMAWYKEAKENTAIHPLVIATLFHHEFTNIHPFDDGNGRMGRLLLNLMVQQYGYTPIVVKQQDRMAYYQVLRQADAGEYLPINEYMSELMKESLSLYIKGGKGESIEEEDDIDKEIMLFKKSLDDDKINGKYSRKLVYELIADNLLPIYSNLLYYSNKLNSLFLKTHAEISLVQKNRFIDHQINVIIPTNIFSEYNEKDKILNKLRSLPPFMKKDVEFKKESKIEEILFTVTFEGFKKSLSLNNQSIEIIVTLHELSYRIIDSKNGNELKVGGYGIAISKNEIESISKLVIKNLMSNIDEQKK
ncbi:MAG: Fic family protein [Chitinophagaceae bacterium]|jgi:Fic family protein|nr:Fic family protein [Chitinophagaceae bacterium]